MRGIEGKVVLLGSKGVGKTQLVTKYIKKNFKKDGTSPLVLSFFTCKLIVNDVKIKLQIWDTADQEKYKAVAPMYYRNAHAAILVFDLSQYWTFHEIKSWVNELNRNVQEPMILILVGNKLDIHQRRVVPEHEAFAYASSIGATYIETSAETEQGVEKIFSTVALGLIRLANEGKNHSLRQFDSCDSISVYTNANTAFSQTVAALAENDPLFRLQSVHRGVSVDDENVKISGTGRLETPSWSIEHIALGEEVHSSVCCL